MSEKTPVLIHPTQRLDLLEKGRELFNEEQFYEAHEVWERLWKMEMSRDREFIQGLIQVAAHFFHIRKGNMSGAQGVALKAVEKLAMRPTQKAYVALDIEPLVSALDYNLGVLGEHAGELPPLPGKFLIPKLFPR